jgi:hypothetical protein
MKRKKIAKYYLPAEGISVEFDTREEMLRVDSKIKNGLERERRKRSMEKKFATAKRIMVNAGKKQAKKLIKKYK